MVLPSIPEDVFLFGQYWKVVIVPDLLLTLGEYGNTNFFQRQINIAGGVDLNSQWATLLHEVIHAVDHELVLGLSEETVHRLGAGLWGFVGPAIFQTADLTRLL